MHYVYILASEKFPSRFYSGETNDLRRRFRQHTPVHRFTPRNIARGNWYGMPDSPIPQPPSVSKHTSKQDLAGPFKSACLLPNTHDKSRLIQAAFLLARRSRSNPEGVCESHRPNQHHDRYILNMPQFGLLGRPGGLIERHDSFEIGAGDFKCARDLHEQHPDATTHFQKHRLGRE